MNSKWFRNRNRYSSKHFSRNTKFSFPRLVTFFCRLVFGAANREAYAFLEEVDGHAGLTRVGSGTISKARKKLKPAVFRELLHKAVAFVYRHSSDLERPAGMRILAIDGSRLSLPEMPEIRDRYGPAEKRTGTEGPPQARASVCLDVLNGIIIDALIRPLRWGERRMAAKHLRFTGPNDLILLDRGYAGVDFFKRVLRSGADICARVKVGHSAEVAKFVASRRSSALIRLHDSDGLLELRAVRIELSSGITEVLLTSLTEWSLDDDLFGRLYCLRWGVESQYHFLKAPLQLENFTGRTVLSVEQDFYAHIFSASLVAMLVLPIHEQIEGRTIHCRCSYRLNWTDAFSFMRRKLTTLLLKPIELAGEALANLLQTLLQPAFRYAFRENRLFPRLKRLRPVRFPTNQKSV